jgi:hypothetical protein
MRRGIGLLILCACSLIFGCSQGRPDSSGSRSAEPNDGSVSASPLQGEWDTGPYPADKLRDAIRAAGYTDAEVNEVLGHKKNYEVHLWFDGNLFITSGWDPTVDPPPTGGDHGPFQLLPGNKIKVTCDVCDIETEYTLYSYDVDGTNLTLRYIRDVQPDYSADDRHMSLAYAIANTSLPFHKIA